MRLALYAAAAALAIPCASAAQAPPAATPPPPAAKSAPMALALEAAQTAVAACAANGYKTSATVVDAQGNPRIVLAADGASFRAVESSQRKAYASVVFSAPSSTLQEQIKTDTALAAKLSADPKAFARAGALPLNSGGELVGALGVGGAPGGEKDEACAATALARIKDRL
jgi:uncharacterized protein GlcG (DUF336 family)